MNCLIRGRYSNTATFWHPLTTRTNGIRVSRSQREPNVTYYWNYNDKPIRIRETGASKSGITGRPVPPFKVPLLDIVEPYQKVGWHKSEYPSISYPILTMAIPHRSFQINEIARLPSHYTQDVVLPIQYPKTNMIFFLFDKPVWLRKSGAR